MLWRPAGREAVEDKSAAWERRWRLVLACVALPAAFLGGGGERGAPSASVLGAESAEASTTLAEAERAPLAPSALNDYPFLLQRVREEHGWARRRAEGAVEEYLGFLQLLAAAPKMELVASNDVDLVWHEHLLDTQNYLADNLRLFGRFLHHRRARSAQEYADIPASYERTKKAYRAHFGREAPPQFWGPSTDAASMCGGGNKPDPSPATDTGTTTTEVTETATTASSATSSSDTTQSSTSQTGTGTTGTSTTGTSTTGTSTTGSGTSTTSATATATSTTTASTSEHTTTGTSETPHSRTQTSSQTTVTATTVSDTTGSDTTSTVTATTVSTGSDTTSTETETTATSTFTQTQTTITASTVVTSTATVTSTTGSTTTYATATSISETSELLHQLSGSVRLTGVDITYDVNSRPASWTTADEVASLSVAAISSASGVAESRVEASASVVSSGRRLSQGGGSADYSVTYSVRANGQQRDSLLAQTAVSLQPHFASAFSASAGGGAVSVQSADFSVPAAPQAQPAADGGQATAGSQASSASVALVLGGGASVLALAAAIAFLCRRRLLVALGNKGQQTDLRDAANGGDPSTWQDDVKTSSLQA